MLKIRQGLPRDAATLSELAFRSKAHWGYDTKFMQACRDELSYQESDFSASHFAVAENPQTVGFYSLTPLNDSAAELDALFVDPDHIGQGYGRSLLTHAKIQAKVFGAHSIVIASDPNAVEFYQTQGAIICGEKPSASIPERMLPLLSLRLTQ